MQKIGSISMNYLMGVQVKLKITRGHAMNTLIVTSCLTITTIAFDTGS